MSEHDGARVESRTLMLPEVVAEAARRFADTVALATPHGWGIGYRQLDRFSDEAAVGLATSGIAEGSVVALVLPSTVDYVVAYLALAKLGAVTAGVNPRLARAERAAALDVVDPDRVISTHELSTGISNDMPTEVVTIADTAGGVLAELRRTSHDESPPALPHDPDRPVAIVLTSGTTGRPKGAWFSNRELTAVARFDVGNASGTPGRPVPMLASTQFAHIGFMTKLPWYLRMGSTIHLLDHWRAADVLDLIERTRMPSVGGVAPQLALLLRVPDFERRDFSAVKTIVMGGAASPPALVEEARRRFDAAYSIRYSSTESGGIGTATAFDAPDSEALYTVGRQRPGIDLEIRSDDDRALPVGEVGQVCLRSPTTMRGYWHAPEETAAVLINGWLHTGDLGWIDDAGCLRLAGRSSEMYIRGGYNVHPQEVEAVLGAHPAVAAVAVVPRPDDVMGEIGVAVVVPAAADRPPSLDELRDFASDHLAKHKLPEALRVVDELPLTPMQKLDRRALIDWER